MKTKQLLITICLITASVISQAQTTGTFTDPRDGQVYKTISIEDDLKGTSVTWMAQNLNYMVDGAFPYNKDESYRKNLGLLYTFERAKRACPAGWHIPSKAEFENLLKLYSVDALRSTKGWMKRGGTNSSGFNAYPAGYAVEENSTNIGGWAEFWIMTDSYLPEYLSLADTESYSVASFDQDKYSCSMSVRCIKNN